MDHPAERRAELIVCEALERPAAERAGFLDEACGEDIVLRAEVKELLQLHDGWPGYLREETVPLAERVTEIAGPQTEAAGERIGNYRLLEQIGMGGFGTVWVAEQEQPVRRRVALKILKPGMDTKEVIARFEQERQALAMMDHPNIAKVFDAGMTPAGRPFFVMELIRGVKITKYSDQANLPTAGRLKLFTAVCHAVQHAHQKGIIHRDLKPSNILVMLHDGVPVPKVIDFGVAKAMQQQRLTDLTIYTQLEKMVGTPLYMSPEQAEMSGLDIDTRSDIYSLGVLLYELLTGRTPFDPEDLMKHGLDEMRRVVREEVPRKPSTCVSTMALDLRTNLARHRQTDGAKLIGQIRGDLDWIVMKALEKDRTRRYETASGFAQDLERHLRHEPVLARPPSAGYRLRRFVRRHRIAFAAGSAVIAALLAGMGVSLWMYWKEKNTRERAVAAEQGQARERAKAEAEALKSGQVARFLKEMLDGVGPSVARGRDTGLLREILENTAQRVGNGLKDQPAVEAELREVIGNVYAELGEFTKAEAMHAAALAARRMLFGNEHPEVASALTNMAVALSGQGRWSEAEAINREALAMKRKLLGEDHPTVADAVHNLADDLWNRNKLEEAEAMHREALRLYRKLYGDEHREVAASLGALAAVLDKRGRHEEAIPMLREALTVQRKTAGNDSPEVADSLNNLAVMLSGQNQQAEAASLHREALAIYKRIFGPDHSKVATSFNNLAGVLYREGKFAEAEGMFRDAIVIYRKLSGAEHPNVLMALQNLANTLSAQKKLAEVEPLYRDDLGRARKSDAADSKELEARLGVLADNLWRQNKFAEAEPLHREQVRLRQARLGPDDESTLTACASLGRLLTDWAWAERTLPGSPDKPSKSAERAAEAERLLRECLAGRRAGAQAGSWRTGETRNRLGAALVASAVTRPLSAEERATLLAEAEAHLLEGNEAVQNSAQARTYHKRDSIERIVRLYEALELPEKTTSWRERLQGLDQTGEGKPASTGPRSSKE